MADNSFIQHIFQEEKEAGRLPLIAYLPAGFPSPLLFPDAVSALSGAGVRLLEVGIPDRQPHLDGRIIANALKKVQAEGVDPEAAIEIGGTECVHHGIAGIGMLYYNTLEKLGTEKVLAQFKAKRFTAILVPDYPVERWNCFSLNALNS
ncbi:MAG: tryptophan synthase subunit alpha, partial [Spirochaetota bacterium]